jgi:hypothetical protein
VETKTVLDRYAKYYDFLQRLGDSHFSETPTIKTVRITKGVVQSAYKEMKEVHFPGNLIDYLCLISTEYMVAQYKKFVKELSLLSCAQFMVDGYSGDPRDINNLLRLAMKNPGFLYDLVGSDKKDKKTVQLKMDGFQLLYELWLQKYLIR